MVGFGPGGEASQEEGDRQPTEIRVRLSEENAPGVYANTLLVHHSAEEFVMDFSMVIGGTGVVVSRIITSPGHMKRIVHALEENLRRYEASHGPVRGAEDPPPMIMGFPVGSDN